MLLASVHANQSCSSALHQPESWDSYSFHIIGVTKGPPLSLHWLCWAGQRPPTLTPDCCATDAHSRVAPSLPRGRGEQLPSRRYYFPCQVCFGPQSITEFSLTGLLICTLALPPRVLRRLVAVPWACTGAPYQPTFPLSVIIQKENKQPSWNLASVRTPQSISRDTICLKPVCGDGLSVLSQEFLSAQVNLQI